MKTRSLLAAALAAALALYVAVVIRTPVEIGVVDNVLNGVAGHGIALVHAARGDASAAANATAAASGGGGEGRGRGGGGGSQPSAPQIVVRGNDIAQCKGWGIFLDRLGLGPVAVADNAVAECGAGGICVAALLLGCVSSENGKSAAAAGTHPRGGFGMTRARQVCSPPPQSPPRAGCRTRWGGAGHKEPSIHQSEPLERRRAFSSELCAGYTHAGSFLPRPSCRAWAAAAAPPQ